MVECESFFFEILLGDVIEPVLKGEKYLSPLQD